MAELHGSTGAGTRPADDSAPSQAVGLEGVHARMLRRTAAHIWFAPGGQEQDLRSLLGWRSRVTVGWYRAGVADERDRNALHHGGLGDRL